MNSKSSGLGILDVILIVNIILKLTGVVAWGWGFVLWPLWVTIIIIIILLAFLS